MSHTRDIQQTFWRDEQLPGWSCAAHGLAARPINGIVIRSSPLGRLSRGNALYLQRAGVSAAPWRPDYYPRAGTPQL